MSQNSFLPHAVADAQLLLSHAARSGIALEPNAIAAVTHTAQELHDGTLKTTEENEFWLAFCSISMALKPVTVQSLWASEGKDGGEKIAEHTGWRKYFGASSARWAVRRYTAWILIALISLLAVQVYWLLGQSIVRDIAHVTQARTELQTKLDAAKMLVETQKDKEGKENVKLNADVTKYEDDLANLDLQFSADHKLLENWSIWSRLEGSLERQCTKDAGDDLAKADSCIRTSHLQIAEVAIDNLQRYLLPLLYGLLGASVYVLRTLASQIRTQAYAPMANVDFQIRLYLGALGGLVSAWFILPEQSNNIIKSLSPFAVAFLAGYGVELVFAAMDKLLSAFTSASPAPESKTNRP